MKPLAGDLSISFLGCFQVELEGQPVVGFRTAKVRALLAYLAFESQRPWSRATLADLLWPDLPEKDAQSNLRNAISNLRKVIGDSWRDPPYLLVTQETLQFNTNRKAWLDVTAFSLLVATASQDGEADPEQIDRLEAALSLYQGDFLESFSIDSAPFEEWVLLKSEQIRQQVLEVLRRLVAAYLESGNLERALLHARRWVEVEPWDESAHRTLMRIFLLNRHRNAALAQYDICRERLKRDLSIEPEAATTRLYEQIRSGRTDVAAEEDDAVTVSAKSTVPPFLRARRMPQSEAVLFVARQKEMERLEAELELARQGNGRILFITGDPGSGKTALLVEFNRRAMLKDLHLVITWGQCNAYTGEADPYFPFREMLQTLGGDLEARVLGGAITPEHAIRLWRFLPRVISTVVEDGPDLINRFLAGKDLVAAAQVASGISPEVAARLGDLVTRSAGQPARTRLPQNTLYNQLSKVLSRLSQYNPLVLILDDLQWIDSDSVNLLFHLGRRLAGSRILLLGAYRPQDVAFGRQGERHPLEGVIHELQTSLGDIHLDLLQGEGTDFVHALLDSEPNAFTPSFRTLLHRHTGGHPLFTIELLRGMQLKGEIFRNEQGKWVEGTQLNWDELPARVEAAIAERIGHLPQDQQELLSTASVEGEQFTAEIIARIGGKEDREVIQALSQDIGKRHRLVVAQSRKRIHGHTLSQYRFRHFLYQKYLYQHLDAVEKTRLHETIGTALETIYEQELSQYPQVTQQLAWHFDLAGVVEKAVRYYTASGKYAVQLGANREAFTHFERALTLLKTLPATDARDQQELGLRLSLGPTLTAIRGWAAPELEMNYRRAEELGYKMADDARLIPALWLLSIYRLGRSEHVLMNKLLERAVTLAQKINDPMLLSLVEMNVSLLHQGRLIEARENLTCSSRSSDLGLQRSLALQYGMSPMVVALAYLATCLWLMGFPEQAAQCSQDACDFADKLQLPMTTCYAVSRACWGLVFAGEVDAARGQAEKLLTITQQHELRNFEIAALFFLHWINVQKGDQSLAEVENIHQAMQEYHNLGTVLNRTAFLILFAQACATAGQLELGLEALDESISLGQRTSERWFEAEAYRCKGELLMQLSLVLRPYD
jgi:DNA-binding SARP family transcriptional activator